MKKKIKFKIEYAPLSDDRISKHKDFDGLIAAYAVTPKQNVFKRWLNNRYVLFGAGLVVGITFSALMFWNNIFIDDKQVESKQIATEQTSTESLNTTTTSTKPSQDVASENKIENSNSLNTENALSTSSANQNGVETQSQAERNGVTTSKHDHLQHTVAVSKTQSQIKKQDNVENNVAVAATNKTSLETNQADNSIEQNAADNNVKAENNFPPSRFEDDVKVAGNADSTKVSTNIIALNDTTTTSVKSQNPVSDSNDLSVEQSDSGFVATNDTSKRKNIVEIKEAVNKTADAIVDEIQKLEVQNPFEKADSTASDANANAEQDEKPSKKKFQLFPHGNDSETDTFKNRYAQVSFVTPLSTNGAFGSRYLHYFSLNILQGNTGALRGVEIGGLANITKGYMYGAQFGGLLNIVGSDVRGAQFGGLVNTSRSLQGAQFAGITNINQRKATGMQTAGVINLSIADSLFNGLQLAGAVNYNGGPLKGAQISGAANINHKQIDGGQISGAFNVANKINGYQIGVINVAKKMKGFQLGVINISDTLQGGAIGLINVSRNGQFSVDLWGSDFMQVNGGLKIGSQRIYNVYAFGFSPFSNTPPASDSLILKKSSLPFGFGLGLGVNIPIHKAFVNIDMMTWTVHDRYFDWRGLNMLNQLRITGGYRIHKYFGVYAGPVANISIQDNMYAAFKDKPIYEYNGSTNSVRGWLGFVAGVQLF